MNNWRKALISLTCSIAFSGLSQEVIPLYNGERPPESELLTLEERVRYDDNGEIVTIRNVSMPTLTVVRPEPSKINGTAVIIAPGGGFQGLAWQTEGPPTAQWCVENGVTAFILKYRLMPFPYAPLENAKRTERDSIIKPFVKIAVADALEAIKYVRSHASEYGINPAKIGMIGYSAGGTLAGSVAQTYDQEGRPDFVVPVYAYCGAMLGDSVPLDAPPLFLAWATDDPIAFGNPALYEKWRDAGKSVEIHAFFRGGHGFSMNKNGNPSDFWPELLKSWLVNQNLLKEK